MDWREENKLKQKAQEYYEKEFSYNQVYIQGYSDGYAKAIDDFANTLIPRLTDAIYQKDVESMTNLINEIAEQLKSDDCKWGTKQEVIDRNLKWLQSEA